MAYGWRFFENDFTPFFLDDNLAAFLAQVEWCGGVGCIVHNNQYMIFGKAVDVQSGECVGQDAVHQQAVVDVHAEAFAGEVRTDSDMVLPRVGLLLLGIPLEGICQIKEEDGDGNDSDEEYTIKKHEIPIDIASFSAHSSISLCKTIKKTGKSCGTDG